MKAITTITKPFNVLSDEECTGVLRFVSRLGATPLYANLESMRKSLSAPAFHGGRSFLTVWSDKGAVLGTVGVITKEVPAKGEAFLTSVFVERDQLGIIPYLLIQAYELLAAEEVPPSTTVRLGIREELAYLRPAVVDAGFMECYRLLEMRRNVTEPLSAASDLSFVPLSPERLADFVTVHNAAFLASPNGGLIGVQEAAEAVAEAGAADLLQIGYLDGVPVIMFELRLYGSVGWIENLAVHPDYQNRGLGREGLHHAIAILCGHGVSQVRLQVVEANVSAFTLYQSEGFVSDKVVSTFFIAVTA